MIDILSSMVSRSLDLLKTAALVLFCCKLILESGHKVWHRSSLIVIYDHIYAHETNVIKMRSTRQFQTFFCFHPLKI